LKRRYAYLEKALEGKTYLFGDQLTIADVYLFVVTRWAPGVKLDFSEFPNLEAFQKRVGSRTAVLQALREEGLIPEDKAA
ncbi:MAG: glutathione binding-like protein, partial [Woeseiaceae bacterium]